MTQGAAFTLYAIEQGLVERGSSSLPGSPETAELVTLGVLAGGAGAWTLTARGWEVAHAFRRWRFANAGPLSMGVTPDTFVPPAPAREEEAVRDVARDTFARMMGQTPDADAAVLAGKAITAGRAFINARKAAGLPAEASRQEES